jgi:hypothetical protein
MQYITSKCLMTWDFPVAVCRSERAQPLFYPSFTSSELPAIKLLPNPRQSIHQKITAQSLFNATNCTSINYTQRVFALVRLEAFSFKALSRCAPLSVPKVSIAANKDTCSLVGFVVC